MAEPVLTNLRPVFAFTTFVRAREKRGCDVHGEERKYICYDALKEYWDRGRIIEAVRALSPQSIANIETIRNAYTRVFSMLVYTEQLRCFQDAFLSPDLHDETLPLFEPSSRWEATAPIYKTLFSSIKLEQMRFFPLIFDKDHLHDRKLDSNLILPILEREELTPGNGEPTSVSRIVIDDQYNKLVEKDPDDKPVQRTFALKTYEESQARLYRNEVNAYTAVGNTKSDHIIQYYGSFIQSGKHCLILEYADGKNLDEFFKNTSPPRTPEGILQFWLSFSGYVEGVHRIHQASDGTRGFHGDIKPDNMLRKQDPRGNQYRFIGKITDFGYSDFRSVAPEEEDDDKAVDLQGSQQYSAPEASHHTEFLSRGPNRVSSAADIFSLGCVASEAISWIAFGENGRKEYFEKRKAASQNLRSFSGSGYVGCYHNGVQRLPEIDASHQAALRALPSFDKITPKVVCLVEKSMMLADADRRWDAKKIKTWFELECEAAEKEMRSLATLPTPSPAMITLSTPISSPVTPSLQLPFEDKRTLSQESIFTVGTVDGVSSTEGEQEGERGQRGRPKPYPLVVPSDYDGNRLSVTTPTGRDDQDLRQGHIPSPTPSLTVPDAGPSGRKRSSSLSSINRPRLRLEDLRLYREAKKRKDPTDPGVAYIIEKIMRHYVGGRDHLFLIDDSDTMAEHKDQVEDAFRCFSYTVKATGKGNIELAFVSDFSSDRTKVYPKRKTSKLSTILSEREFGSPTDLMEHNFRLCVEHHIIPRLANSRKALSIYIFTDGFWGTSERHAAGVEFPVKYLMDWILSKKKSRTQLMMSFVRFGDSEIGKKHLEFLDNYGIGEDFGPQSLRQPCDIVDTGHISGNVYKLFIGSITRHNDETPE